MEHTATKRRQKPAVQVFKRQRRMSELKRDVKADRNEQYSPKKEGFQGEEPDVEDVNFVEDINEANKENLKPETEAPHLPTDTSPLKKQLIEYFRLVDQHELLEEDG
jgi:hypothetical protein